MKGVVSPEMIDLEIAEISSSSEQQLKSVQEASFLDKVARTSHSPKPFQQEKDTSMCSLKQPSLRQITSSHTSRSITQKM